ncbi:MAG: LLM class flavin-dependent oxidoreductase [Pseudonocardiaceae bacterium]
MRAGIVILTEDRWWSGEPKWRHAEEFGFDHAWTYDHLGWQSLVDGPWFDAIPTLTAAAVATHRIQLGTFVASPNFRHPVPFAREVLTLDDISDGRLLLGVGAGAAGSSYDAAVLGEQPLTVRQRSDRYGEFVDALDGLLSMDKFDFDGEYYRAVGARNLPGCVQRPRVPFVMAANGPRSMRFAVRHGQGWVTTGPAADDIADWWRGVAVLADDFNRALEEADRDPARVRRYLSLDTGPVYSLSSVDTFTDAVQRAHRLGFTDVVVHWPRSADPYCGHESVLERVAEEVLEEVRQL